MRKSIIICIMLVFLLTLTACKGSNSEDLSVQVDNLRVEIDLLKAELEVVTKERNEIKTEKAYLESQLNEVKEENEEKELQEDKVLVDFINKVNIPSDRDKWVFNNSINFHISITNNSEKDIKGIQGLVDIQDMFGVSILKLKCDLTGYTIKVGETSINKDMSLEVNEFMDDHVKVYITDYEDLIFVYTINKIMFTDGTIKE